MALGSVLNCGEQITDLFDCGLFDWILHLMEGQAL